MNTTLAANSENIRARHLAYRLAAQASTVTPTSEQEAIWKTLAFDERHVIVNAGPGVGKTFTIKHGLSRLTQIDPDATVGVIAFNKHIATAMTAEFKKLGVSSVDTMTYNAFGFRACRQHNRRITLNEYKLNDIIAVTVPENDAKYIASPLAWVIRMLKSSLMLPTANDIQYLIERYSKDWSPSTVRSIIEYAADVMQKGLEDESQVDFSDQVYMPLIKNWELPKFDVLAVDESQDTDPAQIQLALRACPTGRMVFIGDQRQAIYAFRGAGSDSMAQIESTLAATGRNVASLPLTITQRCSKSNVRLAQALYPEHIRALENAPEGRQLEMTEEKALALVKPGDLIICRVNKHLVRAAFQLISQGVKAVIRGRDIGQGLTAVVKKLKSETIPALLSTMSTYRAKETAKYVAMGARGENQLQAMNDKLDCLITLCQGCDSIQHLYSRIEKVFADFEEDGTPRNAVILGSVHRTKGLEATRVIVLAPELMPHPMAKQAHEYEQELHLLWIACTRTKFTADNEGETIWCGSIPQLLKGDKTPRQTNDTFGEMYEQAEQGRPQNSRR